MAGRWEWLTQVYQPPFSFLAVGTGLPGTLALGGARGRRLCVECPLRLKNMSVLVCVLLRFMLVNTVAKATVSPHVCNQAMSAASETRKSSVPGIVVESVLQKPVLRLLPTYSVP